MPEIAYYGRGLAHEDVGNVKAAYDDLQRAVALKPKWDAPAKDLARYQVRRARTSRRNDWNVVIA